MNMPPNSLQPGTALRILPAGTFRTQDGRPHGIPAWRLDADSARSVLAIASQKKDQFLVDYEHQSLKGVEAPAAGWFKRMEWRDGDGLYMADVQWTDKAREQIACRQYRYLSPVFQFDHETGAVVRIISVALTNNPALDGLEDLAAASFNAELSSVACCSEPLIVDELAILREQQSAEYFRRAFGFDLPGAPARTLPQEECSLAETFAQFGPEDNAKLLHAFGHLLK